MTVEKPDPAAVPVPPARGVAANVAFRRKYGPGKTWESAGTKHFRGGTKVHVATVYWGTGGERTVVVGRHRGGPRLAALAVPTDCLRNLRVELIYSPATLRALTRWFAWPAEPGGVEAKSAAETLAAKLGRLVADDPRQDPTGGRPPEAVVRPDPGEPPFPCPCCDYFTLDTRGGFDICPVCFWEDDGADFENPDATGGPNAVSLRTARRNFRRHGACEERFADRVCSADRRRRFYRDLRELPDRLYGNRQ